MISIEAIWTWLTSEAWRHIDAVGQLIARLMQFTLEIRPNLILEYDKVLAAFKYLVYVLAVALICTQQKTQWT